MVVPLLSLLDPQGSKVPKEQHGFLYRRVGIYEKIEQIIAPFFFEVFDGAVNGLSGLGKDIYAPMQIKDKMACSKTFNVFMRSSILMQAKSATGRQKAALTQIGNVTVIPEGYDVQQSTILGDIESAIAGWDVNVALVVGCGPSVGEPDASFASVGGDIQHCALSQGLRIVRHDPAVVGIDIARGGPRKIKHAF